MTALELFMLRSYLDGELDEAANESFELLLLERPDLAERVDADSAMRLGLAGESGAGRGLPPQLPASAAIGNPRAPPPSRRHWPALAAAASLLLAIGLAGGWWLRPAPPAAAGAQLLYVDQTRSGTASTARTLAALRPVVLMVPVAGLDDCQARIEVLQGGRAPLTATAFADPYGYASVVLAAGTLENGTAQVRVRCGDGAPAEYRVELDLKP